MPITDNLCRGIEEKEYRIGQSKERHKVCKRNYINKKRQADKQEYQAMIIQINKDNEYLSTKKKLSDEAFSNWNRGMFDYDKKSIAYFARIPKEKREDKAGTGGGGRDRLVLR